MAKVFGDHSAEVRKVARVAWSDLQKLLEGEAIVLFGGRRIYAKLFHAAVDASTGPFRRSRPLILPPPAKDDSTPGAGEVADVVARLEGGALPRNARRHEDPVVQAMIAGFRTSDATTVEGRTLAAILAAGEVELAAPAHDDKAEPPVTSCTPLLEATVRASGEEATGDGEEPEHGDIPGAPPQADQSLQATIAAIEAAGGSSDEDAQRAARDVAAAAAAATVVTLPEPPAMAPEEMARRLRRLCDRLSA